MIEHSPFLKSMEELRVKAHTTSKGVYVKEHERRGRAKAPDRAVESTLGRSPVIKEEVEKRFEPVDWEGLRRDDKLVVDVWEERDRMSIVISNKDTDETLAEWWDDDARQMFEDGFFNSRNLEDSVLDYAQEMKLMKPKPEVPKGKVVSPSKANTPGAIQPYKRPYHADLVGEAYTTMGDKVGSYVKAVLLGHPLSNIPKEELQRVKDYLEDHNEHHYVLTIDDYQRESRRESLRESRGQKSMIESTPFQKDMEELRVKAHTTAKGVYVKEHERRGRPGAVASAPAGKAPAKEAKPAEEKTVNLKGHLETLKKRAEKRLNESKTETDKATKRMLEDDYESLKYIHDNVRDGHLQTAWRTARNLETDPRDDIPAPIYNMLYKKFSKD